PPLSQVPRTGDGGRQGVAVRRLPAGVSGRRRHPQLPSGRGASARLMAASAHILVLEDDPSVQMLMRKQLTAHGFQVTTASDGLDGLMKLEQVKPDLNICHGIMSSLAGIELVKVVESHAVT